MFTKSKMTDARREVFYAELHALLTAGLDFSHAFGLLIVSERDVRLKALLECLYRDVVGGAALWQSMERSGAFRSLDCGVVRIGERPGGCPTRSISCGTTTANGPHSGEWCLRPSATRW